MFSYAKKQLETIINNPDLNKEEQHEILNEIINILGNKTLKINNYNKNYYKKKRENEPTPEKKPRKRPRPYKKKPETQLKTNNMVEYRKNYYKLNKNKMVLNIKQNRIDNKEKYNEYHKQYQQQLKIKQEQGNLTA
jgi:hypothetical protein